MSCEIIKGVSDRQAGRQAMACSRHAESTITGPETLTVICSVMLTHRTSLHGNISCGVQLFPTFILFVF